MPTGNARGHVTLLSPNVSRAHTHTPPTLLHSLTPSPGSVIFVLHHHKMPSYVRKKNLFYIIFQSSESICTLQSLYCTLFVRSRQSCHHFFLPQVHEFVENRRKCGLTSQLGYKTNTLSSGCCYSWTAAVRGDLCDLLPPGGSMPSASIT